MAISKTLRSEPCVGDPPACCQPEPLTDAEWRDRTERVEAAILESLANQPTRCGQCGSEDIAPMFDPDLLLWQCTDCGDVFAERD